MRLPRFVALAALAVTLAACASNAGATWTYAPAPPATPAPSGSAGGSPAASGGTASSSPSASGTPAVSGSPTESAPASASPGGGGTVLALKAQNIAFDPTSLQAPANTAFQIDFDNEDASVPHNVVIKDANGQTVFDGGTPINGVAHKLYSVNALPAGSYSFTCIVHPNMQGQLTVQ